MERLVYLSLSKIWVSTHEGFRTSTMVRHTTSIDVCAFLNQELHNLKVSILRGNVEAGGSILV
jgi:hypothetical protein